MPGVWDDITVGVIAWDKLEAKTPPAMLMWKSFIVDSFDCLKLAVVRASRRVFDVTPPACERLLVDPCDCTTLVVSLMLVALLRACTSLDFVSAVRFKGR